MSTALVASTGGHLKELHHLRPRLDGVEGPFVWITFDTPQSRSLLAGEEVQFVPFVGGRDPSGLWRNVHHARGIVGRRGVDAVVSTGSSVALPYFARGRLAGLPCHYIESAARLAGPSLTGRLMRLVPGVNRYTQFPHWRDSAWAYRGSVFDDFEPTNAEPSDSGDISRVVVTLGSYRGYEFSRLIRRLLSILPSPVEVLWQTGETNVDAFAIDARESLPEAELSTAMAAADVVVSHAGVGAALAALEAGKCPLLVPRRRAHNEHVDDHQVEIARDLSSRGLAVSVEVDELVLDDLVQAGAKSIAVSQHPAPFVLSP